MKIKTIGIIGYGQFGKFLESLGKKYLKNIQIKIYSKHNKIDNQKFFSLEEITKSDILIIATSIDKISETIQKIKNLISENTIVVDVSTVKVHPEKEFKKAKIKKYLCTHPMFGPFSYQKIGNKLDDLRIVLTGHNLSKKEFNFFKKNFKKVKLKVIEIDSKTHDKLLAETLFLTHLIAQTVVKAKYQRTEIDTVSFGFLMHAIESVQNDKKLFQLVYKYNSYCKKVVEKIEKSFKTTKEEIKK